jgi:uncharacterized protein YbjQ (UPF0145 family)
VRLVASDEQSRAGETAEAPAASRSDVPQVAVARLQQLRRTSSWTSDLSVDEFAAVRAVGFDPAGQVMGTTVDQIGQGGWGSCGVTSSSGFGGVSRSLAPGVVGTRDGSRSRWVGYPGLVQALYAARRRAVRRLEQECRAVGGDGVVGVTLTIEDFPGAAQALEFQAMGTAVRARGGVHPTRPFLTDLSGQEFAKLLSSGWVPCGLVFGVAVGVRHDDYRTRGLLRSWRNGEVAGYTDLVHHVRAQVRSELADDVARHGGAGVVVQDMTLRVWEQECRVMDGVQDHVAQATIVGTAVSPFRHTGERQGALQIMRLGQEHGRVVGRRLSSGEQGSR